MTVFGVSLALVVGLIIGGFGWFASPGRRGIPIWLTLTVGVAAALLGAVITNLASAGTPGSSWRDVLVQVSLAVIGVGLVAGTAGGRPSSERDQ